LRACLLSVVLATMRLEKASIWLRDRDGWLEGRSRREDRLSPSAAGRRVLRPGGNPSDIDARAAPRERDTRADTDETSHHFADGESEEFRERLSAEGFRLLVPLVYRERLMG